MKKITITELKKQLKDLAAKMDRMKLEDIAMVQVGYKGAMTTFVAKMYEKAFIQGVLQVQDEMQSNADPTLQRDILKAKASIVANNISERVKTIFLSEYLNHRGVEDNAEWASRKVVNNILKG